MDNQIQEHEKEHDAGTDIGAGDDLSSLQRGEAPRKSYALLWVFAFCVLVTCVALYFVRDILRSETVETLDSAAPAVSSENTEVVSSFTEIESTDAGADSNSAASTSSTAPGKHGILTMLDAGKAKGEAENGMGLDDSSAIGGDDTQGAATEFVEDTVMRTTFIDDIAPWLVSLYYPQGTHPSARKSGIILADIARVNQRYGIHMTGLSWTGDNVSKGRATVLKYIFQPKILDTLYDLYANRFIENLATAAQSPRKDKSRLTKAQTREMYALYSNTFRNYATVLSGVARMQGLERSVVAWQMSSDKALEANMDFTQKLYEYDDLREAGRKEEATQARKAMDAAAKRYQQAIILRERARENLIELLRKHTGTRHIDDSSLLYVATWAQRRLAANPFSRDALQTSSMLLRDLATRLDAAKDEL